MLLGIGPLLSHLLGKATLKMLCRFGLGWR
jgi:hypothetical protein